MGQRRSLPLSTNGFNLRPMVAAVIYVRVSTKEQTENLSLPTQLHACEEYCRRAGYGDGVAFDGKQFVRTGVTANAANYLTATPSPQNEVASPRGLPRPVALHEVASPGEKTNLFTPMR